MTLADFTAPGLMVPQVRGADAASVIKELSEVLHAENRVPDLLAFCQAALHREFMSGTEMEAGMSFPHARLAGVRQVCFALGRSVDPLRWGQHGARSVRLVFLLAVPTTDATEYLQLISGLVRLSKDAALVGRLLAAREPCRMHDVLLEVSLRLASGAQHPHRGAPDL